MTNTYIYNCPADKTPYVMLALYVKAQQYSRGQRTQCNYNNISMGAREARGERGVGVARLVPGRKRRIRIALGTPLLTLSPTNAMPPPWQHDPYRPILENCRPVLQTAKIA